MSLILEGIDMPKTEYEEVIIRIKHTGEVCDAQNIHLYAQAIQIDRPHGRIGDLDGVIKQIDKSPTFASKYKGTARLFIDVYSDSNTILEAEENR